MDGETFEPNHGAVRGQYGLESGQPEEDRPHKGGFTEAEVGIAGAEEELDGVYDDGDDANNTETAKKRRKVSACEHELAVFKPHSAHTAGTFFQ